MTPRSKRRWWNTPRFDVFELTLLVAFALMLAGAWVIARRAGSVRPG